MTKRKPPAVEGEMATASIMEYFATVEDPRIERSRLHPLSSMLVLSLCAVVCGANSFSAIECFGTLREDWFRTFLDLPHGIPSHDTLARVFAMLNPKVRLTPAPGRRNMESCTAKGKPTALAAHRFVARA